MLQIVLVVPLRKFLAIMGSPTFLPVKGTEKKNLAELKLMTQLDRLCQFVVENLSLIPDLNILETFFQ